MPNNRRSLPQISTKENMSNNSRSLPQISTSSLRSRRQLTPPPPPRHTISEGDLAKPIEILVEIVGAYDIKTNPKNTSSFLALSSRKLLSSMSHSDISSSSNSDPNVTTTDDGKSNLLNPYCVIKQRGKTLHKTEVVIGTRHPVWTVRTGSLFLLSCTVADLLRSPPLEGTPPRDNALLFHLRSRGKDSISSSTASLLMGSDADLYLGHVAVDLGSLLDWCDEERREFTLRGVGKEGGGSLALRFRVATSADKSFLDHLTFHRKNKITSFLEDDAVGSDDDSTSQFTDDTSDEGSDFFWGTQSSVSRTTFSRSPSSCCTTALSPRIKLHTDKSELKIASTNVMNMFSSFAMRTVTRNGVKMVAVRPGPDPRRPTTTQYMTPLQLDHETSLPSHNWIDAGSGDLGVLHLEILSCHGLPNLDAGEAVGNYSDAFICAVFEDAAVETCVIDDELSPRWLPWTQRAFRFRIAHPASVLHLGVFDYDLGIMGHESIGRVAVNLQDFVKDTVYTLRYDLFPSSDITDREAQGSITIRLRLEIPDEKKFIMEGLKPRPPFYVNVKKEKSFKVIQYTCYGEHYNDKFEMKVFRSYINELFEYKTLITYAISDSILSLLFWRGQVRVSGVYLPLHSLTAFVTLTHVIEYPHLILPFIFFSIAWFLIACRTARQGHPSPWYKGRPLGYYSSVLRKGSYESSVRVESGECEEEARDYERRWRERLERDLEIKARKAELQLVVDSIGKEEGIGTKVGGGEWIELLARMARYQRYIKIVCGYFRRLKLFLSWEESIISFWITAVFMSLSLITLLLPWRTILYLVGKLLIWTFLGPWMKIVDLYLKASADRGNHKALLNAFQEKTKMARKKGEEAEKLKAIKSLKFGSFSTLVPAYNLARHYDRPLPDSFAYDIHHEDALRDTDSITLSPSPRSVPDIPAGHVPGQQLHGVMIPRPERDAQKNSATAAARVQKLRELREQRLAEMHGGVMMHDSPIRRVSKILAGGAARFLNLEVIKSGDEDSTEVESFGEEDEEEELGFEVVASDRNRMSFALSQDRRLEFRLLHSNWSRDVIDDDSDSETESMIPSQVFVSNKNLEFLVPAWSSSDRSLNLRRGRRGSDMQRVKNNDFETEVSYLGELSEDQHSQNDSEIWEQGVEVIYQHRDPNDDDNDGDDNNVIQGRSTSDDVKGREGIDTTKNIAILKEKDVVVPPSNSNRNIEQSSENIEEILIATPKVRICKRETEHNNELSVLYRQSDHVMVAFCHRQ